MPVRQLREWVRIKFGGHERLLRLGSEPIRCARPATDDVERARADKAPMIELTYNWDAETYTGGRNFGHLAYRVANVYDTCARLAAAGVTINRPPRDGHMAFVRSPDGISIELLQEGQSLAPAEPWSSMPNTGSW